MAISFHLIFRNLCVIVVISNLLERERCVMEFLGVGRSEEGRGQAAGACCRLGGSGCGGRFSGSCCGPGGSCCGPAGRDGGGKGESRAEAAVRFAPEGAAACGQADRVLAVGSCSMRSQFLSAMRSPRVEYSQHSNGMPNVVHCIFLGLISM